MSLVVSKEKRGEYHLIRVNGALNYSGLHNIRKLIDEIIKSGVTQIALELSETTTINSGGIGLLINANKKLVNVGGALHLIAIQKNVKSTVESTGILNTISCIKTVSQADTEIG